MMKKIIFALTFVAFSGTMLTTVYAASTGTKCEIRKDDKKKRKKKGASCSAEKSATGSSCTKGSEGKSCCSKKH
jgi:hypothetical protein